MSPPIRWLGPIPSGLTVIALPLQYSRIGREVAFQAYHPGAGISRPAVGVLR